MIHPADSSVPARYRGRRWWWLAAFTFCAVAAPANAAGLQVENLRCEYRVEPRGMDVREPRFSWTLTSFERGQRQTAYQVLVASSPEELAHHRGDLWDSGRVMSGETAQVVYGGRTLTSRRACWWKVRVWDAQQRPSRWSAPATWTMGLLEASEWRARWIADPEQAAVARAPGPRNGFHSGFVTNAATAQEIVIDLGRVQPVDALRLFPARPYDWQPDTPGFLFPLRFRLESAASSDFVEARTLVDRTAADEPNPGTNAAGYSLPVTSARWFRFTVTRLRERDAGQHAFALAELELGHGSNVVSQGAAVTMRDAIESGAWSKANLTDGERVSTGPAGDAGSLPATLMRKAFSLPRPVRRATAYVTALGLYELRINGQRVGENVLAPEWTSYRHRVQYQVYDVTRQLRPGENVVGALVAEGWYAGRLMVVGRFPYGTHPRLLLQLEIEQDDGIRQYVVSDGTWRTTGDGSIAAAGIYDGETCDLRKEPRGWETAGFDDATWKRAAAFERDDRLLVWQRNEPIRVTRELAPARHTEPRPGVHVYDFGQNVVGWCRLRASGRAGQVVTLRHAEMLNDDGTLYTANLRAAPQVDRCTPRQDGTFDYEPRFTYHGFRFVEVTGVTRPPALCARVLHSAAPEVGSFACSNPSLERLMQNILWTQRANLMSSPNDCPQRDERFGWMGDIQAFAQTAMFQMDLAAFGTKWLQDVRDDQAADGRFPDFAPHPGDPNRSFSGAPAWADAGVIVPWRLYENYGDRRILDEHFEAARRWVDSVERANPGLLWRQGRQNDYNDWLNGDWVRQAGWPTQGAAVPNEVFATAFFAHSAELVARMAAVTGREEPARHYRDLAERIRRAFQGAYVGADGRMRGDTQGGYALALSFDLLPEEQRSVATRHLVEGLERYQGHLSTGIQTTHRAMLELVRNGRADLGWQLLTDRRFPSWFYMLDQGATTIWERWDGYVKGRGFQDPGMNSFNHWAFGAVGEWVWRHVVGLNPDVRQPGWRHFVVAPRPGGGVTWVRASYASLRGPIRVEWGDRGGGLTISVDVPPGATATIRVPTSKPAEVLEGRGGGRKLARETSGVRPLPPEADAALFEVQSGRYRFSAPR